MLTRTKMALAGAALMACAIPAAAQAQPIYMNGGYGYGYTPAYDAGYGYGYGYRGYGYRDGYSGYGWNAGPFWPIGAAAGLVGAAANAIAAPFVGWRNGYWVDDRIDPVGYSYGWGTPIPTYGDVPVSPRSVYVRSGWRGGYTSYGRPGYWGGYVATYRGKAHHTRHMMHHARAMKTMKHKARHHMAAR